MAMCIVYNVWLKSLCHLDDVFLFGWSLMTFEYWMQVFSLHFSLWQAKTQTLMPVEKLAGEDGSQNCSEGEGVCL